MFSSFAPMDDYSYPYGYSYPTRNSYAVPPSYGYPNAYPSAALERERYLQALREEEAAKASYEAALAREQLERRRAEAIQQQQQEAIRRRRAAAQQAAPYFNGPFASAFDPFGFRRSPSPVDDYAHHDYDDYVAANRLRDQEKLERQRKLKQEQERFFKLQEEQTAKERARKIQEQEADGYDDLLSRILGLRPEPQRQPQPEQHQQAHPHPQQQSAPRAQPKPRQGSTKQEKKPEIQSKPTRIPITTPEPKVDKETLAKQQAAAATIQSHYRAYTKRRDALSTLIAIAHRFTELRAGFVFPITLDFNEPSESGDAGEEKVPSLQYSHNNGPVHAYEDGLVKLLQKLDAVESGGDKHIREERRKLVRNIERELEVLDERKAEMWRKMKESEVAEKAAEVEMEVEHLAPAATEEAIEVDEPVSTESATSTNTTMDVDAKVESPVPIVVDEAPANEHATEEHFVVVNSNPKDQSQSIPAEPSSSSSSLPRPLSPPAIIISHSPRVEDVPDDEDQEDEDSESDSEMLDFEDDEEEDGKADTVQVVNHPDDGLLSPTFHRHGRVEDELKTHLPPEVPKANLKDVEDVVIPDVVFVQAEVDSITTDAESQAQDKMAMDEAPVEPQEAVEAAPEAINAAILLL